MIRQRRAFLAGIALLAASPNIAAFAQAPGTLQNPFEDKLTATYEVPFADERPASADGATNLLRQVATNAKAGRPSNVTFQLGDASDVATLVRRRRLADDLLREVLAADGVSGEIVIVSGNPNRDVMRDTPPLAKWPLIRVRFKVGDTWW